MGANETLEKEVTSTETETGMEVSSTETNFEPPEVGTFIAATYNGKWYIGQVMDVDDIDCEIHVSFMTDVTCKTGITYKWPKPSDDLWVPFASIICKIADPSPIGRSKRAFVLDDGTRKLIDTKCIQK